MDGTVLAIALIAVAFLAIYGWMLYRAHFNRLVFLYVSRTKNFKLYDTLLSAVIKKAENPEMIGRFTFFRAELSLRKCIICEKGWNETTPHVIEFGNSSFLSIQCKACAADTKKNDNSAVIVGKIWKTVFDSREDAFVTFFLDQIGAALQDNCRTSDHSLVARAGSEAVISIPPNF